MLFTIIRQVEIYKCEITMKKQKVCAVISFSYLIFATGGVIQSRKCFRTIIFVHYLSSNFLLFILKRADLPNFCFNSVVDHIKKWSDTDFEPTPFKWSHFDLAPVFPDLAHFGHLNPFMTRENRKNSATFFGHKYFAGKQDY